MQEEYAKWVVVHRWKANNKARNKQHMLEMSQSVESNPMQSSITEPRAAKHSKKDGKRKTLHTQPVVSLTETYKITMSNHSKSTLGRGAKGTVVQAKINQKDKNLVGFQPVGLGPSNTSGLFVFRLDVKPLKLDGAF